MEAPALAGERVVLRAIVPTDMADRQRLGWHREIELGYGRECASGAMTDAEARSWFRDLSGRQSATSWVIEVAGDLAGVTFLHSVQEQDAKARYAIGMFAPQFIGRGLGTEATRLVLHHAFTTLGLHRVDLRVLAFNTAAITSYRKCGFVDEGRERQSCRLGDKWYDDVIMGALAAEFNKLQ